jgi:hypothetical protein
MLGLNTKVKVTEASRKDKLIVKQIMAKFNVGENSKCMLIKSQVRTEKPVAKL